MVRHHSHHGLAANWFSGIGVGEAYLCRVVQLGLIRLLGNRAVMGPHVVPAGIAWLAIETFLQDERIGFAPEPPLDLVFPTLLKYPVPTNKLVGDAYLAAFSIAASLQFVTLDRGFRQFAEIDLLLLEL